MPSTDPRFLQCCICLKDFELGERIVSIEIGEVYYEEEKTVFRVGGGVEAGEVVQEAGMRIGMGVELHPVPPMHKDCFMRIWTGNKLPTWTWEWNQDDQRYNPQYSVEGKD